MGTKTIGIREDVYERLNARKREDESFTDLMDRLLDEAMVDWRNGFGTLADQDAEELGEIVTDSRDQLADGLSTRQRAALRELTEAEADDETA
jgi:predicted CopG family antitoxin